MRVSVVIATYGEQRWSDLAFERAFPSARAQERAHEVVIHHYPELSLSEARNAAARDATGDYLCFLDADDELDPHYLDSMLLAEPFVAREVLAQPLLVPAVTYVHENGWETPPGVPNRGRWPQINECVIGTLVEASLFRYVGGFREWPSIEDYDLWLRCHDAGAQLVYVEGAIYRAHVNPDGGRNRDQACYAMIWAEHVARTRA